MHTERRSLLVDPDELEARLGDPDLRIIDCDMLFSAAADGNYTISSGLPNWRAAHIPDSVYVDIGASLSAAHPRLQYMLPSAEQFARVMSALGVANDHEVVVYSRTGNLWATRLCLMFLEFGHERVRVLDGGWDLWVTEGRRVSADVADWPATDYRAAGPRGLFVGREAVIDAMDDEKSCVINALSPAQHAGERFHRHYGRPGRIPGSANLFFMKLIDPDTNRFLSRDHLEQAFRDIDALDAERVVTYCGGGIAATADAFALLLLGRDNVSVYDASLTEWGNDHSLPMETD